MSCGFPTSGSSAEGLTGSCSFSQRLVGLWKHQEGQEEQGAQVITGIPWSGSLEPQKSGRTCREHGGDSGRHVVLGWDGIGVGLGKRGRGYGWGQAFSTPPHLQRGPVTHLPCPSQHPARSTSWISVLQAQKELRWEHEGHPELSSRLSLSHIPGTGTLVWS